MATAALRPSSAVLSSVALAAACAGPGATPVDVVAVSPAAQALELVLAPDPAQGLVGVRATWIFDARVASPLEFEFGGLVAPGTVTVTDGDGRTLEALATPSGLRVTATGDSNRIALAYSATPADGLVLASVDGVPSALIASFASDSHWLATPRGTTRVHVETSFELPSGWTGIAPGNPPSAAHDPSRWRTERALVLAGLHAVAGNLERMDDSAAGDFAVLAPPAHASAARDVAARVVGDHAAVERVLGARGRSTTVVFAPGLVDVARTPTTLVAPGLVVAPVEWLGATGARAADASAAVATGLASQWIGTPADGAAAPEFWRGLAAHTADWVLGPALGEDVAARHLDAARRGAGAAGSFERGYATAQLARLATGDGPFVHALRSSAPIVDPAAFLDALEKSSGLELEAVLAPWLNGSGVPELRLASDWRPVERVVLLELEQRQTPADGVARVFAGPIDVEIVSGRRIARHRIELTQRSQVFRLPCEAEPTWLRFDATLRLPHVPTVPPERNGVLARASRAETNADRVDALREIARLARVSEPGPTRQLFMTQLCDALWRDPSAWVRETAARELGTLGGLESRATLERSARQDADLAVRAESLASLRRFAPDPALARLSAEVFGASTDAGVRSAAARLHAAADPEHAASWLAERFDLDSPHGSLRATLLDLWSRTNAPGIDETLVGWAADPLASDTVRAVALARLVERARPGRTEPAGLVDLLASPDPRWRTAAIDALARSQSRGARTALAAFAREASSRPEAGRAAAALERR
jgi:hypothetical protein